MLHEFDVLQDFGSSHGIEVPGGGDASDEDCLSMGSINWRSSRGDLRPLNRDRNRRSQRKDRSDSCCQLIVMVLDIADKKLAVPTVVTVAYANDIIVPIPQVNVSLEQSFMLAGLYST